MIINVTPYSLKIKAGLNNQKKIAHVHLNHVINIVMKYTQWVPQYKSTNTPMTICSHEENFGGTKGVTNQLKHKHSLPLVVEISNYTFN